MHIRFNLRRIKRNDDPNQLKRFIENNPEICAKYNLHNASLSELEDLYQRLVTAAPADAIKIRVLADLMFDLHVIHRVAVNDNGNPRESTKSPKMQLAIDSIPSDIFMDYTQPTPQFNVGDLLWADSRLIDGKEGCCFRAVVVGACVYVDDVYYQIAPFDEQADELHVLALDVDEENLSTDSKKFSMDPHSLKIVK